MKSYKDFKGINEADGAANPLQELEAQIDHLFDELKQKLRSPATPRSAVEDDWGSWIAKNRHKYEWNRLEEYHAIKNYSQEFHEALTSEENIDAVLDEYREKLKQVVRNFVSSQAQTQPAVAASPVRRTRTPKPAPSAPAPKQEPEAVVPPQAPKQEPETVVPPKQEVPVAPAPAPQPQAVVPKPAPTPVAPQKPQDDSGLDPEEEKMMRLGAAVHFARDLEGEIEVSPEDIKYGLEQPFNPKSHMSMKDIYIKTAQDYLKSKTADTSTKNQVSEPTPITTSPQKGAVEGQPPVHKEEPPMPDVTSPTREDLESMTPKQFKHWLLDHDPELASAYEPEKWWTHNFRNELIDSYMHMKDAKSTHHESLQHKVNKYKEMLRKDNRPEPVLLREAAQIPFKERVAFYKKKLQRS